MLALFAAPAVAAELAEGPVAVLPFQNIGANAKLEWLRVGMAETMLSDLQRSGKVAVVERAQLDRALAELALAGHATDESSAAKVGKLVGAKTVVVGAFQEAGNEVRLSARFVTVETGVVKGAAKVTGPVDKIFGLQDAVVEKLLGVGAGEVPRIARRPPRKVGKRTFDAYRIYAQSLQTSSEAERVQLLKQSIAIDPDFVYASDDLAALEKRMVGYSNTASQKLEQRQVDLMNRLSDGKSPAKARIEAAHTLFDELAAARRYHALADAADKAIGLKIIAGDERERASFVQFFAQERLHQYDLALQLGERYLKEFPLGAHFRDVEGRMQEIAGKRKKRASRKAEFDKDLDEKRHDAHSKLEADWAPCICARWNDQVNELMIAGCGAYLAGHASDPNPDAQDHARAARYFIIWALSEKGDFETARPLAEKLRGATHEWDEELQKLMSEWPTD
jgi:TolB-like protein